MTARNLAAALRRQARELNAMADALERSRITPAPAPRTVNPAVRAAVLTVIRKRPGLSARELRQAVSGHSNADADEAARALERDGAIEDVGQGRAREWWPRTANESANGTAEIPSSFTSPWQERRSGNRDETPNPTEHHDVIQAQREGRHVGHVAAQPSNAPHTQTAAEPGPCASKQVEGARR